jgi:hypothetical protein
MDETRKRAYKMLMYQALLDLKNGGSFNEENFRRNFRIAHAFHNLASFIVEDFDGFDEAAFWSTVDVLAEQFDLHHYREIFNEAVTQS